MSIRPDSYFDVGKAAIAAGYRVVYVRARRQQQQILFDTARDVAAAAHLCEVPVLTTDSDVFLACRAVNVRVIRMEGSR